MNKGVFLNELPTVKVRENTLFDPGEKGNKAIKE